MNTPISLSIISRWFRSTIAQLTVASHENIKRIWELEETPAIDLRAELESTFLGRLQHYDAQIRELQQQKEELQRKLLLQSQQTLDVAQILREWKKQIIADSQTEDFEMRFPNAQQLKTYYNDSLQKVSELIDEEIKQEI